MQIIDLDVNIKETAVHHPNVIEKYLVVLMEIGLVILSLKYEYTQSRAPTITLIKNAPKMLADCICPNIYPIDKEGNPCFWMAKDNWIQLIEIDIKKPQKLVPIKSQKYEFEQRQAKATAIRQSYLKQTNYVNGEDIEQIDSYIAVATSDSVDVNEMGGGMDVIIVYLQIKELLSMTQRDKTTGEV